MLKYRCWKLRFENLQVSIFDRKTNEKEYSEQLNYPLFDVGGVMVSLLTSGVVDRVFEPPSGQDKDYRIGIFFFSTQHVTF
jgi:hypothetical protein